MKYIEIIGSDKVYLSPINQDDYQLLTKFMMNASVRNYLSSSTQIINYECEKEFIQNRDFLENNFAIVHRQTDELIGVCGFVSESKYFHNAEIGINIGNTSFHGQGMGQSAVKLLLHFGFRSRNYHGINLYVFAHNTQAINCYEKCGFKHAGRFREHVFINGKYEDLLCMDMLFDDFNALIANEGYLELR